MNPYINLSKREIKKLIPLNKDNPAAIAQLEEALKALTPYGAGRLKADDMSTVGLALAHAQEVMESMQAPTDKIVAAIALLAPFKNKPEGDKPAGEQSAGTQTPPNEPAA